MANILRMLSALFVLVAASAGASAQVTLGDLNVDPNTLVRPALLEQALAAWRSHPDARRDVIAVVDFGKVSSAERFFVIDLRSGSVEAFRTAHGKGSDSGRGDLALRFSNVANSEASSLGAYLTAESYIGKHGLSLALEGLDETNSNARARAIVIHSAPYMAPDFIAAHGRPGRSWGCFVFDPNALAHVVARLEGGALVYAGA